MHKSNLYKKILFAFSLLGLLTVACGGAQMAAEAPAEEFMLAEAEAPGMGVANDVGYSGDAFLDEGPIVQTVERIVIQNADIALVVEDPAASMQSIAEMAEDVGGFVVSSNLHHIESESGVEYYEADITIRVPAEELSATLETLEADSIRVLSKNRSGQDVTREYTDQKSRLRNLESAEERLREIMASATKTEDVLTIYQQLTEVREKIEITKGQIEFYEQSAAFSAISISLRAEAAVQPLTIGGWEPVGVARDAIQALINTLQVLINIAIWLVLFILPVLLFIFFPLALIWRGVRAVRRRFKKNGEKKEAKPKSKE